MISITFFTLSPSYPFSYSPTAGKSLSSAMPPTSEYEVQSMLPNNNTTTPYPTLLPSAAAAASKSRTVVIDNDDDEEKGTGGGGRDGNGSSRGDVNRRNKIPSFSSQIPFSLAGGGSSGGHHFHLAIPAAGGGSGKEGDEEKGDQISIEKPYNHSKKGFKLELAGIKEKGDQNFPVLQPQSSFGGSLKMVRQSISSMGTMMTPSLMTPRGKRFSCPLSIIIICSFFISTLYI